MIENAHNFIFDSVTEGYDTTLTVVQSIYDYITGTIAWKGQFRVTETTKGTI